MRKLDIARRIHQDARISEEEAATLLDWILEFFKTTLQKGEPVSISNLGVATVMPQRYCSPRWCGVSR
jgi:nucleoid DNA-binding protein